jgi:hypothetical protein
MGIQAFRGLMMSGDAMRIPVLVIYDSIWQVDQAALNDQYSLIKVKY